jgi:hypothetical protein
MSRWCVEVRSRWVCQGKGTPRVRPASACAAAAAASRQRRPEQWWLRGQRRVKAQLTGSKSTAPMTHRPRRGAPCGQVIPNTDVVVGDVMLVDTGDKIIADGIMVDGHHLVRGALARLGPSWDDGQRRRGWTSAPACRTSNGRALAAAPLTPWLTTRHVGGGRGQPHGRERPHQKEP